VPAARQETKALDFKVAVRADQAFMVPVLDVVVRTMLVLQALVVAAPVVAEAVLDKTVPLVAAEALASTLNSSLPRRRRPIPIQLALAVQVALLVHKLVATAVPA